MGVPYPPVFHSQDSIPFKLILWSESVTQLQQLAQPRNIQVAFVKNDVYGPDALVPRSGARRNRRSQLMGSGKIWRDEAEKGEVITDDEAAPHLAETSAREGISTSSTGLESIYEEEEDEHQAELSLSNTTDSELPSTPPPSSPAPATTTSPHTKNAPASSRWASFMADAEDDADEEREGSLETGDGHSVDTTSEASTTSTITSEATLTDAPGITLPPSPPESVSDQGDEEDVSSYFPGMEDAEKMVTLSGTIPLGSAAGRPSSNYKYMSRHVGLNRYLIGISVSSSLCTPQPKMALLFFSSIWPKLSSPTLSTIISPPQQQVRCGSCLVQNSTPDLHFPYPIGIYAEAPVWITTDLPKALSSSPMLPESESQIASEKPPRHSEPQKYSDLPVIGTVVRVPSHDENASANTPQSVTWYPPVQGAHTDKARPTWKAQRLAAF